MSQDAVNQLISQVATLTIERMALVVFFSVVLAFLLDRGISFLRERGIGQRDQQMVKLVGQIASQNATLQAANEKADERYDKTVSALNASIDGMTKAVQALTLASEQALTQGNRIEGAATRIETQVNKVDTLLTNGRTSTAGVLEAKMIPIEQRLTELEAKADQELVLLRQIIKHLGITEGEPPAPTAIEVPIPLPPPPPEPAKPDLPPASSSTS